MSLISTYQSRKSLFAEKLEDKGVEASATDGLTTLINKIDDIEEGFTEGLLLYAENNIVQKEDTVDLYALLLEDGKPVPNKTVEFMGLWSIVAGRISHVPPHYKITNVYDSSGIAYLDDDHHFKIENSHFYKDDVQQSDKGIYTIELNQNNLTVVYIGGTSSTFDVSNYDMSVIETNKNMLEIIFYASGTTGSDGVASYTYTGVGEGLKEVYAKYGTLVSETYEFFDCIRVDNGTSSDHNDFWYTSNGSLNRGDTETELVIENGKTYVMSYFNLSNTDSFVIEFDVIFDCIKGTGNPEIQFRNSSWTQLNGIYLGDYPKDTWTHIKLQVKDGQLRKWVGNTELTPVSISNIYMFDFYRMTDDNYLKFKNFRYYPI